MKDKLVISGMSCRFPKSESYQNFWENLISHTDMVTSVNERWSSSEFKTPERYGKISHPEYFDSTFFGVHNKQAERMDPQLRLLLEISYEAFIDAGIDPDTLKGSNTGVFIGACFSDAQTIYFNDIDTITGYENSGCSLSMFANRLSYYYDLHGPSQTIDTACSSSLVALDAAVKSINEGLCEYAIVGGANMIFNPAVTLGFSKLKMLSPTGSCKSFDTDADGYARSEGIGAIIITRQSLAKRIRATILGSAINSDGYTDKGITFPSGKAQAELLSNLYKKCKIDVNSITYLEAHGTGTAAGDPQELNAIDEAFKLDKRDSTKPLLVGSVKSNMGHAEGAAGMASVIKVLLAMEHNMLPANLHYTKPNENIPSLIECRIKVVDKNTDWEGGIVGVNSFGFGGTNAHIILEGGTRTIMTKNSYNPLTARVPIIPFAARTQSGLDWLINSCISQMIKPDATAYLQDIANRNGDSFLYRGCIVNKTSDDTTIHTNQLVSNSSAPVCFIFPGMGSQWAGMGAELLDFPAFKNSLEQSQQALIDTGINLLYLITDNNEKSYNKPTHVFSAITAIQIALVNLVSQYGISPDLIIGHSVGEIACGYADGSLTHEQAIRAAYYRGLSIEQCSTSAGKMAVVSMTWDDAIESINHNLVAACHNSEYSVTLSGDGAAVDDYVSEITKSGGEIKLVESTGIAFHSHLIASAAPQLRVLLQDLIDKPQPRSQRWICTSRPESEWDDAKLCSAEYFVDNLINPVRFYDALKKIPENSIIIEIGPHSLMRASIIDTVQKCHYVNFMRREHNCRDVFLDALAQCYTYGLDIDWSGNDPVGTEYPHDLSICPAVAWDHSIEWTIPNYSTHSDHVYHIDLSDDKYAYLVDHKLNGRVIFPGVGYLFLVWTTVAKICHKSVEDLMIQFKNIKFHRATMIPDTGAIKLIVRYLSATTEFEIVDDNELVVSGKVIYGDDVSFIDYTHVENDDSEQYMLTSDIYKELRLRGYDYGPAFQGINKVSLNGSHANVKWDNNWITFLDSLLHASVVKYERCTLLPTSIRSMTIKPSVHTNIISIESYSDPYRRRIYSSSVVIEDLDFTAISPVVDKNQPLLRSLDFVPFIQNECISKASDGEFISKYIRITQDYILHRFNTFLGHAEQNKLKIPKHILRLKSVLNKCQYVPPSSKDIDNYKKHPKAIMLRLAENVYDNMDGMLNNAMATIVSYYEYKHLYDEDIAEFFLFDDRYLGAAIQIVMQNVGALRPVNICEVGVGTGGIMSYILPMLRSKADHYTGTDISSGFFPNLKKKFAAYQSVTDYIPWDISKKKPNQLPNNFDLIVASNVIHATNNIRTALSNIHDSLSQGGFFLLHETTHGYASILGIWGFIDDIWNYNDDNDRSNGAYLSKDHWLTLLEEAGFDLVSINDDGLLNTLYLCRKKLAVRIDHVVHTVKNISTELTEIQEKLKVVTSNPDRRLWLQGDYTNSPGLLGLINCSRNEFGGEQIRSIYIDGIEVPNNNELQAIYSKDLAVTVYKNGIQGGYYYFNMAKNDSRETDNAYMDIGISGDLSTLQWIKSPEYNRQHCEYEAYYCALNFKDVMLATGKLSSNSLDGSLAVSFGGEFSGISVNGQRVMGYLNNSMTTKIRDARKILPNIWDVPVTWTLEEAATVPVVYMTAFLALIIRADIRAGQRILIHSGTGGVGQAAIRIALAKGCEVFTSVGTQKKREVLKIIFPQIDDAHIYSSRNTDFEDSIMEFTKGKGVNVVLNSLADEKLEASMRVLARYGTFVEIGRYDMAKNTQIGMSMFLKDTRFIGVGLDNVLIDDLSSLKKISELMKKGIQNGVVVPLDRTVFNHEQLEDAFRYMAKGQHTGKVLLKIREETEQSKTSVLAKLKYWCNPGKTYIITGGLGGVGFELINWLVKRGAKHITIISRSSVKNGYQAYWLNRWEKQEINVTVSNVNITDMVQTSILLEQIESLYPVGGIFHLAMVLDDAFLVNQSMEKFNKVIDVKYNACRILDEVSRKVCVQLDHFVMFSSISAGYGNPGQSNYGYANYAMDRLCEKRKLDGYHALSIQWGAIGDVGFVNENIGYVDVVTLKIKEQSLSSCLDTLDNYLNQDKCIVTSYVPNCDILSRTMDHPSTHAGGERTAESLVRDIKNIIGIPETDQVDENKKFMAWGVDSLMTVEIVGKLDKDYGIRLRLADVQHLNLATIRETYRSHQQKLNINNVKDYPLGRSEITNRTNDQKIELIFELVSGDMDAKNVVYFVSGFASDPHDILENIKCPTDNCIYTVRFENSENMDNLGDLWEQHIRQLADKAATIRIVGHSIGATIIHRFKQITDFSDLSADIEFVAISTPKNDLFKLLNIYFPLETIDEILEDLVMTQLSTVPWYSEFKPIGYNDIRNQAKFIFTDHFYSKELSEVDTIVLPKDDELCWSVEEAQVLSKLVIEVEGIHDAKSVQLDTLLFQT